MRKPASCVRFAFAAHGAADAAVVHLDNLLVAVLHQQLVVDAGFSELVFDHGDALAVLFLEAWRTQA